MLPNICMTVQGWKNAINVLTQYTIIIRKYFNAVMHIAQGLYCARHIIIITIAIIVAMKCKRPACAPVTTNRISIGHGGAPRAHTQCHNHKLDCKKKNCTRKRFIWTSFFRCSSSASRSATPKHAKNHNIFFTLMSF